MKFKRILLIVAVLVAIMALVGFARLASAERPAETVALDSLIDSETVDVDDSRWITFSPTGELPKVGFIFYPGGYVAPEAYAPTLHAIAEQGFLVIDVPMPFGLAVMGANKAEKVIAAHPEIEVWVIGGHSLGGAMAASFAANHPDQVRGLVLWAAYPPEDVNLQGSGIAVLSISGTLDGLAHPRKIESSSEHLPEDTSWLAIEGGNHAQFGYYGEQKRDNPAIISRAEQQAQVIQATAQFLAQLASQLP